MELIKLTAIKVILFFAGIFSFIFHYLFDLTATNAPQFIAILAVIIVDAFFGITLSFKNNGFQTFKALKSLRYLGTWWVLLALLLVIEAGITGASWLSETVLIPFVVFYIISILKNAHLCGYINSELVEIILKNIDKHKEIK